MDYLSTRHELSVCNWQAVSYAVRSGIVDTTDIPDWEGTSGRSEKQAECR